MFVRSLSLFLFLSTISSQLYKRVYLYTYSRCSPLWQPSPQGTTRLSRNTPRKAKKQRKVRDLKLYEEQEIPRYKGALELLVLGKVNSHIFLVVHVVDGDTGNRNGTMGGLGPQSLQRTFYEEHKTRKQKEKKNVKEPNRTFRCSGDS